VVDLGSLSGSECEFLCPYEIHSVNSIVPQLLIVWASMG
jgi:hypothetical protein